MQLIFEKHHIEKLRKIYKKAKGKDSQLAQAILLYMEGWSLSRISKTLGLDPGMVAAYLQECSGSKTPGMKRLTKYKLTPHQAVELKDYIEKKSYNFCTLF